MSDLSKLILNSWQANSDAWIDTIDQAEISSRSLATNQAIIDSIQAHQPKRVLDIGCGEGWLCRALSLLGIIACGIDGASTLIKNAKNKGGSPVYYCHTYQEIREKLINLSRFGTFDLITFNFALFEENATTFSLLEILKSSLTKEGSLIIQTIGFSPDQPSEWHSEDWKSLKRDFPAPFPWYYRNSEEWKKAFEQNRWNLQKHECILHPVNKTLLSWIFTIAPSES